MQWAQCKVIYLHLNQHKLGINKLETLSLLLFVLGDEETCN